MKVAFQGSLDGLCGMYALANALDVCGYEDSESVMREACRALGGVRMPDALIDGTTYADMQKMTKRCREVLDIQQVDIRYPFKKNIPRSNQEYWQRFDEIFADESVRCAIIGIEDPFMHWIVAGHDNGHVQFLDSTYGRPMLRKKRSSLVAGSRKSKPSQWLINRQELIVFSVRPQS